MKEDELISRMEMLESQLQVYSQVCGGGAMYPQVEWAGLCSLCHVPF